MRNQSIPSAKDIRGPSPLVAIENEAPAKLIIELADPTHKVLTSETVKFTLPDPKTHT